MICPCCKNEVDKVDPLHVIASLEVGRGPRRILMFLYSKFGQCRPAAEVIDYVYADDEDGGPDSALQIVSGEITKLRRMLEPHGLTISRGTYTGYKMMWLDK